jgi:hypothetical protein
MFVFYKTENMAAAIIPTAKRVKCMIKALYMLFDCAQQRQDVY